MNNLSTHSIFLARAKDHGVKTAEMSYLAQCCLQASLTENQDYQPRFIFAQLRFTESCRNDVVKLQEVFQRVWLIAVVLPKMIGLQVLELAIISSQLLLKHQN